MTAALLDTTIGRGERIEAVIVEREVRGELSDGEHLRGLTEEAIGVPVTSVSFSELRADATYLDALRDAISADLATFRGDGTEEALSRYLGRSIRIVAEGE